MSKRGFSVIRGSGDTGRSESRKARYRSYRAQFCSINSELSLPCRLELASRISEAMPRSLTTLPLGDPIYLSALLQHAAVFREIQRAATKKAKRVRPNGLTRFELPLLGSNQDS